MIVFGGGVPDGFDWNAYDKQKAQREHQLHHKWTLMRSYMPALQRCATGGATNAPVDQALILACVQLVFDQTAEDLRELFELQHRHEAKPQDPPAAPPPPPPAQ